MKKDKIIPVVLIVVSLALAIVCFFLLPDTVVTQISAGGGNPTTMPKIVAIIIPLLLGVGGAFSSLTIKDEKSPKTKCYLISGVGIAVSILTLVVNLFLIK